MRSFQKATTLYLLVFVIVHNGWTGVAGAEQKKVNSKFTYYLKSHPGKPMTLEEISALPNPPKNLFVYVHGWNSNNLEETGAIRFKDHILKVAQDFDAVMTVDWTPNTDGYFHSKNEVTPIVSQKLFEELKKVKEMAHIPPAHITMTAHSLGNKVIGEAGRKLKSSGVGLIKKMVVLDTPDPAFAKKGDAAKVIGLHTSKSPLGTQEKFGDEDYFFNKFHHQALKPCFKNRCLHSAVKEIGMDYFGGELVKCKLVVLNADPRVSWIQKMLDFEEDAMCWPITIFVLDYSGSMQAYGRIDNLIASTKSRLANFPLNREVAMVVFGSRASVSFGPTNVTDESVRQKLVNLVPGSGHNMGGTSIGAGLVAAVGLIPKGRCGAIILATDGEENEAPFASQVRIPRCSTVSSLASGPQASKILEGLAERHGGKVVSVADNTGEDKFNDGLRSIEEAQNPPWLQTVKYPAKQLKIGSASGVNFLVDSGLKDIQVKHTPVGKDVEVTVTPPNGNVSGCKRVSGLISCAKGTPGKYIVKASRKKKENGRRKRETINEEDEDGEEMTVRLLAFPDITAATLPMLLDAGLSNSTVDPQNDQLTIIFGELKSELNPVLGADVEASLTSPQGDTKQIKLYDDGVGADETKGDGIYSRYISTPLVVGQRYEVVVRTSCLENGKCKVRDFDGREKPAEMFEREVIAGSLRALSQYKAPPPAAVSDLAVLDYDKEDKLVTLRWTAVGANADSDEVAAGVKIKWAADCNSSCQWEEVDGSLYQETKLEGTPREFQQVKLAIPMELAGESGEKCVYFNVIYHNNQTSAQDSNIVSTCDWKPEEDGGMGTLTIAVIVVGLVAALGGVGIGFIKRKKLYTLVRSQ